MCLSTRKQFKSCGVYASCVCQQGRSLKVTLSMHRVCQSGRNLKVVVSMHPVFINKGAVLKMWGLCIMRSSTRKEFKSCGLYASCCYQQRSGLKVVVSMHHVFVN